MWFPNEDMDVNKFVAVHIPSKSSYLQKFGFSCAPKSLFTGDEFAPFPKDKIANSSPVKSDVGAQEKPNFCK